VNAVLILALIAALWVLAVLFGADSRERSDPPGLFRSERTFD
jgi:hypothetical protein